MFNEACPMPWFHAVVNVEVKRRGLTFVLGTFVLNPELGKAP